VSAFGFLVCLRGLVLVATLAGVPERPPPFADHVPRVKELGKINGKYVIDTETEVTLDGIRLGSLKEVPAGAVVVEVVVSGLRVSKLGFKSPVK
jgi:hypothetical protein